MAENSDGVDKKPSASCSELTKVEDDMDELLDEALEDFSKPPPVKKDALHYSVSSSGSTKSATSNNLDEQQFEAIWNDESMLSMANGLQGALEQMAKDDPLLLDEFQKFQRENSLPGLDTEPTDFDESIAKTMEELTKNLQGMANADDAADFGDMMRQIQQEMGNDDGDGTGFMNVMQGMMQNLLSKDILYPSLKEIQEMYPGWLSKNKETLSPTDYDHYKQQEAIVRNICLLFEEETDSDSEDVKRERMTKIVDLMQQMQRYGHPPADMMSEISGDNSQVGSQPPECALM